MKAAPQAQRALLELQELDNALGRLAHREQHIPERSAFAEAEQAAAQARTALAEVRGRHEDASAELGRLEADTAVVVARIDRDSQRLVSSASVKDVAALESELASLQKRRSDLEDMELAVMEQLDALAAEVAQAEAALEAALARRAELSETIDRALAQIAQEREEVAARREAQASATEPGLLALYERQRARYGIGAALLRRGVSGGSGVALTESDLAQIRKAAPDDVVLCPDSGCILVRTEESGL